MMLGYLSYTFDILQLRIKWLQVFLTVRLLLSPRGRQGALWVADGGVRQCAAQLQREPILYQNAIFSNRTPQSHKNVTLKLEL